MILTKLDCHKNSSRFGTKNCSCHHRCPIELEENGIENGLFGNEPISNSACLAAPAYSSKLNEYKPFSLGTLVGKVLQATNVRGLAPSKLVLTIFCKSRTIIRRNGKEFQIAEPQVMSFCLAIEDTPHMVVATSEGRLLVADYSWV